MNAQEAMLDKKIKLLKTPIEKVKNTGNSPSWQEFHRINVISLLNLLVLSTNALENLSGWGPGRTINLDKSIHALNLPRRETAIDILKENSLLEIARSESITQQQYLEIAQLLPKPALAIILKEDWITTFVDKDAFTPNLLQHFTNSIIKNEKLIKEITETVNIQCSKTMTEWAKHQPSSQEIPENIEKGKWILPFASRYAREMLKEEFIKQVGLQENLKAKVRDLVIEACTKNLQGAAEQLKLESLT